MKKVVLVGLFLGLASLQLVAGQANCATLYTSCSDCTADPNCGWCGPVGQCMNGTSDGPSTSKCFGEAWRFGATACPTCSSFSDCRTCVHWEGDCAWCQSTGTCAEWGKETIGCKPTTVCPCNTYDDCSSCTLQPACSWCAGTNNTCINSNNAAQCVMIAHTCPCSYNSDCHSCRQDAARGCRWCETGGAAGNGGCVNAASSTCPAPLNCNAYCQDVGTDCNTCNNLNGCVWCGDSNTCVDSLYATCMIRHTCPNCAAHRYCDPCLDEGNGKDCVWCGNGECREAVNPGAGCAAATTCQSYCTGVKDCNTCNSVPGCGWCETSKSCVDADESSCLLAHTCTDSLCKFDGGAFVGGMFLGIGLVAIGVGGYLFYKWKMGGRGAYNELR